MVLEGGVKGQCGSVGFIPFISNNVLIWEYIKIV